MWCFTYKDGEPTLTVSTSACWLTPGMCPFQTAGQLGCFSEGGQQGTYPCGVHFSLLAQPGDLIPQHLELAGHVLRGEWARRA